MLRRMSTPVMAGRLGRENSISYYRSSGSPSISLMCGDSRTFATKTVVVSTYICLRETSERNCNVWRDFRAVYFRLFRTSWVLLPVIDVCSGRNTISIIHLFIPITSFQRSYLLQELPRFRLSKRFAFHELHNFSHHWSRKLALFHASFFALCARIHGIGNNRSEL